MTFTIYIVIRHIIETHMLTSSTIFVHAKHFRYFCAAAVLPTMSASYALKLMKMSRKKLACGKPTPIVKMEDVSSSTYATGPIDLLSLHRIMMIYAIRNKTAKSAAE